MINKMKLNMNSVIQVTQKPLIGVFCFTLSLGAFSVQADGYAGLSAAYSDSEHRTSTGWLDSSPALAQIQFGYFFSDYVALEGRYATSVKRNDDLAIDGLASALVKANMPVTDRLALYALAGYSYVRADYQHQTTNDSGATFGVGLHYALSGKTAITGEFVNYLAGDDVRLTALQFGMQFKF
ncbi:outer membrane beta-barrel protein [Vibrio metschnikovii]|uniref:outer membrane beta-barrel protein n=1 Tax=Vibrio metschnikovii TaxID=28172 RepID=UPI001E437DD3|nr:outer membrane beta-barrel protein [Vibrio metschnikovii]